MLNWRWSVSSSCCCPLVGWVIRCVARVCCCLHTRCKKLHFHNHARLKRASEVRATSTRVHEPTLRGSTRCLSSISYEQVEGGGWRPQQHHPRDPNRWLWIEADIWMWHRGNLHHHVNTRRKQPQCHAFRSRRSSGIAGQLTAAPPCSESRGSHADGLRWAGRARSSRRRSSRHGLLCALADGE